MICKNCGNQIEYGDFCNNCGASIYELEEKNVTKAKINNLKESFNKDKYTFISNMCGIISSVMFLAVIFISLPVSITGVITGIMSFRKNMKVNYGLVLSTIVSILSIIILIYFFSLYSELRSYIKF